MEKIFYLAQVFGALNVIAKVGVSVFGIVAVFTTIGHFCSKGEEDFKSAENFRQVSRVSWIVFVISFLLLTFVPSKQTFLLMVGGAAVDALVEDHPQVKELPGNTLEMFNEYIKHEIDLEKQSQRRGTYQNKKAQ